MKRRNFCKTLIGAAVAAALPALAGRHNILFHTGNPALLNLRDNPLRFAQLYGNPTGRIPYYYQRDMLRQMNFYQHGARIHLAVERGIGKTNLYKMNYGDVEKRVLAALNKKDHELLKTLSDFEDAESWRGILPK